MHQFTPQLCAGECKLLNTRIGYLIFLSQKVEDLGNYKLLTAKIGSLTIKSKISRETVAPLDKVDLHIPEDKCCIYENEKLI